MERGNSALIELCISMENTPFYIYRCPHTKRRKKKKKRETREEKQTKGQQIQVHSLYLNLVNHNKEDKSLSSLLTAQ